MAVVLTVCVVLFAVLYFRRVESGFVKVGVLLGAFWFAISVVIDLLMFTWGPMKMPLSDYMTDIGLTYLIYPIVTTGIGLSLAARR